MKSFFLLSVLICTLSFCVTVRAQSDQNATIIGRWLSEDDEKRKIVFTQINMVTYYDKKITSTSSYEIHNDTLIATDKNLAKTNLYSIETLTDLHLSLMLLENGHVTFYRKEN